MAFRAGRLLSRLRRPDAIRAQVLTYLFLAQFHNLVKSSYDDYLAGNKFQGANSATNQQPDQSDSLCMRTHSSSHNIKRLVLGRGQEEDAQEEEEEGTTSAFPDATDGGCRRRWASAEEEGGREGDPVKLQAPEQNCARHQRVGVAVQDEWDWRGFPGLWTPFKLYELASTAWMIWAAIRTLFLKQLEDFISPLTQHLFGLPGNCLLPGRLALPLSISPLITVFFASYHLGWRVCQKWTKHDRLISMVVFLLASERDLERFYARLGAHLGRPQSCLLGSELSTIKSANSVHITGMSLSSGTRHSNERLFLSTTCYQVYGGRNSAYYFKLRLNRTARARAKLVRHVALTSLAAMITFSICMVPFLIGIVAAIYSDYRYAHVYRGCYPPLEKLRASGQLDYFTWPGVWNGHHLLSGLIFDALENIIIWSDMTLALIFGPVFVYLLNYDLLLHWSGLEVKLERLLGRVKRHYLLHEEHMAKQVASIYSNSVSPRLHALGVNPSSDLLDSKLRYLERSRHTAEEEYQPMRLENDIHEIQFEVCDFLNQMERADGCVGDSITMAILVWLSGCAFASCNQLLYSTDSITIINALVLAFGFFVMTLATFHLMELRRCCLKSHRALCSLMAYDQSRHKQTFAKLLEYYTSNRTNYHILRTYAYKPTTFISIVGWSFSYFIIAFTLFGRHGMLDGSQDELLGIVGD